ncbi:hypothetical protein [Ruminococcus sp.]|uniref:hypothetical protein n=1 Tax=Ruminococcus sp. TaxID=41978 RepID=UPI0025FB9327|nr:hypothetical protein [Ruminococcus sp.]
MSKRLTLQFQPSRRLTPQSTNSYSGNQTIAADLNRLKHHDERRIERNAVESGHYYILEIVRPDTREARSRWGLDGTRNINGVSRVVSRQRMYVANVWKSGNEIRLECRGYDNFGRCDDGIFVYYQTPMSIHQSSTFVLSLTRLD